MSLHRCVRSLLSAGLVASALLLGAGGAVAASDGHLTQPSGATHCFTSVPLAGSTCTGSVEIGNPSGVAASPDGKSVYLADYTSNALSVFSRASNGTLTHEGCFSHDGTSGSCTTATPIVGPAHVAVSPDGKNVYLTLNSFGQDNGVAIFDRNTSTGDLTIHSPTFCISESGLNGCADGRGLNSALDVAMSPNGNNVYVTAGTSGAIAVFARDGTGGLTQAVGGNGCIGPAEDSCTAHTGLVSAYAVAVSPDGANVYVAANGSDTITDFSRDSGTGNLTWKACYGSAASCAAGRGLDGVQTLAVSADGQHLYAGAFPQLGDTAGGFIDTFTRTTTADSHLGELTQLTGTDGCISEDGTSEGVAGHCHTAKALSGMYDITLSADGKNLYATAFNSPSNLGSVTSFAIGGDAVPTQLASPNGCFTHDVTAGCTQAHAIQSADGVAVTGDGKSVYVSSQIGGLAEFQVAAVPTGGKPAKASFAKSPKSLRVSKKGAFTYRFDGTKKLKGTIAVTKGKTVLAKGGFTVPNSGTEKAKLKLSHNQLKKLKKAKHEKTKVTVVLANSVGTSTARTSLTLKAPK